MLTDGAQDSPALDSLSLLRRSDSPRLMVYRLCRAIWSWWPLYLVLGIAIWLTLLYIRMTYVDLVYEDAFIQVPYVGQLLSGGSFVSALFSHPWAGEHLLLGYRLWSLINARFFGLNLELDPVMFMLAYTVTAILVFADFRKSFAGVRRWVLLFLFAPVGLLCFSLVAPVGLNMTTEFVWGSSIALLVAFLIERYFATRLTAPRRSHLLLLCAVVCIPIYFGFFSGAYFPGLLIGLLATYLARGLLQRMWFDRGFFLVAAVAIVSASMYLYFMISSQGKSAETSGGLELFFRHPIDTMFWYLASMAASVLDSHTLAAMSPAAVDLRGAAMAAIIVVALVLFVRTRMYRVTYLPIFCIFYPVGIATSVFVGRDALFGSLGITNEWYSFQLRLYVVGTAWILLYALVRTLRNLHIRSQLLRLSTLAPLLFVGGAFAYIGVCQWVSTTHQLTRAPYVRQYYLLKERALVYPQFVTDAPALLLWPAPLVRAGRAVLSKYHLASFAPANKRTLAAGLETPTLSGSWYDDNWVGRSGSELFLSPHRSDISISAYVPGYLEHDHIVVRVNGARVMDSTIPAGTMQTSSATLRAGKNVIAVTASVTAIPARIGVGTDVRVLGVHLVLNRST